MILTNCLIKFTIWRARINPNGNTTAKERIIIKKATSLNELTAANTLLWGTLFKTTKNSG